METKKSTVHEKHIFITAIRYVLFKCEICVFCFVCKENVLLKATHQKYCQETSGTLLVLTSRLPIPVLTLYRK